MKTGKSPAKLYLAFVRRLHFLALLAVLVPGLCQIVTSGMTPLKAEEVFSHYLPLYLLTLTLAFPAAFLYLLQEKVKSLGVFLLCACPVICLYLAGLFAVENALSVSIFGFEQVPQALILLLYLLDAIRMRTNDNARRKAAAQGDLSWSGDLYLLPVPSLAILLPFAAIYLAALFLHSDHLAQVALIGAILYFFLVLPYHVLIHKEEYLERRHHVNRIPEERISRLQTASLFRLMIPCAVLAAAALMSAGGRHFLNLPKFRLDLFVNPDAGVTYEENGLMRELIALRYLEAGSTPPQWLLSLLTFIDNVLTILLTALLFYGIYLGIRSVVRRFRREYEEDPALSPSASKRDEHVSLKDAGRQSDAGRGRGGIRRRYRRTILRFRGGPPDLYETPTVMEQRSQLPDTPAMRALHEEYERERYARKG